MWHIPYEALRQDRGKGFTPSASQVETLTTASKPARSRIFRVACTPASRKQFPPVTATPTISMLPAIIAATAIVKAARSSTPPSPDTNTLMGPRIPSQELLSLNYKTATRLATALV
eukprot:768818-Hanusia_phi.AAC.11